MKSSKYTPYIFFIAGAFFAGFFPKLQAQDPVFSQFYAAPLQLNPALTGVSDAPTLHFNYRNQWSNINRAYATYSASFSQYAPTLHSGFGMLLSADVAGNGIYNTSNVAGFYAYDIRFSDKFYIRTGMELGFVSKRLNWNKLVFFDQLNPETGAYDPNGNVNPTAEAQANPSINYFDMSLGMMMRGEYWHAGFAVKHLNNPNEAFYNSQATGANLPMRISVHAGGEIPLNKRNKKQAQTFLCPNALFTKQREFSQLNFGAHVEHQNLIGGLWFRHTFGNSDAVIISAGFTKGIFKLGYSYDLTVSKLSPNSGGTHEVSLILSFEDKTRKQKTRYNDCLKIFK